MTIAIIGLGYVGLPLAAEFAKHCQVTGFDINKAKVDELRQGMDRTNEVDKDALKNPNLHFTSDETKLKEASLLIVAVPTPIHEDSKQPDLTYIKSASELIGKNLKKGAIVVYESTVYPGVTEDVCVPIIEKSSNLKCGTDWKIAYSPERIVPGDKTHTLTTITKVVSGMDNETLEKVASIYSKICPIHKASSIKVAEASKVIENVQRDLNIALVNELSLIFHRLGIDTKEVLEAAGTKFNFHKYHPGLVGGHCISVDPYYLTHIARKKGYYPKVILSGREVNEEIAVHIAKQVLQSLGKNKALEQSTVLVMGLTFKENVPDMRNTKIKDLIKELKGYGIKVIGCDPLLTKEEVKENLGIENLGFNGIKKADAVVMAQGHDVFKSISLEQLKEKSCSFIFDIKGFYGKEETEKLGMGYKTL